MTLNEFINKKENIINKETANQLLKGFKNKFVVPDYNPKNQKRSWLLHCNLSCKPQIIPIEELESLSLAKDKSVFLYSERHQTMYSVSYSEIYQLVTFLEPWEEIDVEIFDNSYEWFIAITHDNVTMIYGI